MEPMSRLGFNVLFSPLKYSVKSKGKKNGRNKNPYLGCFQILQTSILETRPHKGTSTLTGVVLCDTAATRRRGALSTCSIAALSCVPCDLQTGCQSPGVSLATASC